MGDVGRVCGLAGELRARLALCLLGASHPPPNLPPKRGEGPGRGGEGVRELRGEGGEGGEGSGRGEEGVGFGG